MMALSPSSPLLKLDYGITVVGNGLDVSDSFTNSYSIEGLGSGTYELCITSLGDVDYEPYCFEVTVSQPEALGVSSTLLDNGERLSLAMSGSDLYFVELNGEYFQTDESELTLELEGGKNALRVSTAKSCQGVYVDEFFVSRSPVVYPNPFQNLTKVFLAEDEEEVLVGIFASNGRLLASKTYRPNGREMELDFTGWPEGVYIVKLHGEKVRETLKVIKQ